MQRWVLLAVLLLPRSVSAVTIDWVLVEDAGNAPDTASNCKATDCGSVSYDYAIGRYEVTNAQYAEFLNAKAASDPTGLWDVAMDVSTGGGVTRSGDDGSYLYTVKPGFEDKPVVYVSFWAAMRFANWMHNGQGDGDTETGAYTITPEGIAGNSIVRNAGAKVFLPDENEWYKAAYYSPLLAAYWDYPTASDTSPVCGVAANCQNAVGEPTAVGSYAASSAYGTFDQAGNVFEWNETIVFGTQRGARGGSWNSFALDAAAASPNSASPTSTIAMGFRVVASVPEPAQSLLALASVAGLAALRRCRSRV